MTEHQTPGWRLLQQLHRDEPSEEQDVIAALEEVTLPPTAASPTGREGTSHSPLGDSSQPWLMGLWAPAWCSRQHPKAIPRCWSSSEETTRGLASGHRGGFGPAQQTRLLCFNRAEKSKAPQNSVDAPDPLKPGFSSSKPQTRLSPHASTNTHTLPGWTPLAAIPPLSNAQAEVTAASGVAPNTLFLLRKHQLCSQRRREGNCPPGCIQQF